MVRPAGLQRGLAGPWAPRLQCSPPREPAVHRTRPWRRAVGGVMELLVRRATLERVAVGARGAPAGRAVRRASQAVRGQLRCRASSGVRGRRGHRGWLGARGCAGPWAPRVLCSRRREPGGARAAVARGRFWRPRMGGPGVWCPGLSASGWKGRCQPAVVPAGGERQLAAGGRVGERVGGCVGFGWREHRRGVGLGANKAEAAVARTASGALPGGWRLTNIVGE